MFKVLFFSLVLVGSQALHADPSLQKITKQVVADLVKDNKNFVNSKSQKHFDEFADNQDPRVTMVLCSDSRVQVHSFSKGGENDVFTARNIGNQFETTKGSVLYGVNVLKTPVLVFIGHSHCGAVKAAMGDIGKVEPSIRKELASLELQGVKNEKEGVVLNVNHQVQNALQAFQDKVDAKKLVIIGAVYDFRNDYGYGKGQLIIVNLNGNTDPDAIRSSHYVDGLKGVSIGAMG